MGHVLPIGSCESIFEILEQRAYQSLHNRSGGGGRLATPGEIVAVAEINPSGSRESHCFPTFALLYEGTVRVVGVMGMQVPPRFFDLPTIVDERGALTVAEAQKSVPFEIRRVYFLHSLTPGSERGGHAHRKLEQFIIAVSGSFRVRLTGAEGTYEFHLNEPQRALYIPPMHWRVLNDFSGAAVSLVLASQPYEEQDYIREFEEFSEALNG